jgi:dTDP-4-amino-4,6-dideoxygalactose transaminase
MNDFLIPFNLPSADQRSIDYLQTTLSNGKFSGDGPFTHRCQELLTRHSDVSKVLLTHSGTGALELALMSMDLSEGDEIILPSFTFSSSANAIVLRGGVPVFVDVRSDTLNIDETLIREAITDKTRAIMPVHYAGVACEMDLISSIAQEFNLYVVEDAAQAFLSTYRGSQLGSIGDFGAFSFHETKNISCGEGGALLIQCPQTAKRASVLREKGTNRDAFIRGENDKYTWIDIGSSFLLSEFGAAVLAAQLEDCLAITARRIDMWNNYYELTGNLEARAMLVRPSIPDHCCHNGHIFWVLLSDGVDRHKVIQNMKKARVQATFHYVPLHSSPQGLRCARAIGDLQQTDRAGAQLIRLPLWNGLTRDQQQYVVQSLEDAISASLDE